MGGVDDGVGGKGGVVEFGDVLSLSGGEVRDAKDYGHGS